MTDRFCVGVVTQTHGIRGEVKVFPTTDDVNRFKKLKTVTAETKKENIELHIKSVKFFKQFVILGFKEYDDINEVEFLRQAKLTVERDQAIPLETDEYYIADLIGAKCFSDEGEELGNLIDVLETGANDVYVIGSSDGKQILVPAIKECILDVDINAGRILMHLMEGLV